MPRSCTARAPPPCSGKLRRPRELSPRRAARADLLLLRPGPRSPAGPGSPAVARPSLRRGPSPCRGPRPPPAGAASPPRPAGAGLSRPPRGAALSWVRLAYFPGAASQGRLGSGFFPLSVWRRPPRPAFLPRVKPSRLDPGGRREGSAGGAGHTQASCGWARSAGSLPLRAAPLGERV